MSECDHDYQAQKTVGPSYDECVKCEQRRETSCEGILAATSNEGLLKAFASLTHQMDGFFRDESDLRAQRDLVQAEILRRMA